MNSPTPSIACCTTRRCARACVPLLGASRPMAALMRRFGSFGSAFV